MEYAANHEREYSCTLTMMPWTETQCYSPLMLDKTVALETLVYARAALTVQLAANQRKQNRRAREAVS